MRFVSLLSVIALLGLLGCQAEEPAAPSAPVAPASQAAPEAAATTPPPAPPVVVEEVVEEQAPLEESVLREDPQISGPANELSDALNARDEERIMDAIALLEEEGGSRAIVAISTVLDRSDDPDMKIEAIDSLAFLADEGDVSSVHSWCPQLYHMSPFSGISRTSGI